jgi:phospholipid/cholesterol/gamma-HCH transport system permease protein
MNFFYHFGKYLLMLKRMIAMPEKIMMYWKETFRQMVSIGIGSFIIISMMSLFIGAVLAMQFAYQLADSFVPIWWIGYVVRDSMLLEMAPTLSCLLLAGKVGSNMASELGTMRITEQVDAMEIMGVNTTSYLIGPKILAAVIVVPMLTIIAVMFGVLGGWFAGVFTNIYSLDEYTRGLQDNFLPYNVWVMYLKSLIFSFIITSIACFHGYHVEGGALNIGAASTRAVVYGSIVLIIADFLITFMML